MYGLDPAHFLTALGLTLACLKRTKVELELLINIDMLLMIENAIRGGICQAVHRYAKANNRYMDNYDENNEQSYIEYLDANELYGWAISQKLPVNGFKWIEDSKLSEFNKGFIKNQDENSNIGHILEVDVEYPKNLVNSDRDFPFLPERRKIRAVGKLICSIEDKEKYPAHIRHLKQALNHGLILKEVHRVTQSNQKAWLKKYIDMNTGYRKKAKNEFEKDFYKLMNNSVFGKTMEHVRNHRDIKLVTTEKKKQISFKTKLSYNKIGNRN